MGREAPSRKRILPDLLCAALVFALAFALRALPELRSTYPVGYDLPFYAYAITHIYNGRIPGLLGFTPLFFVLAWLAYRVLGLNVFAFLKLLAPATYGLLASSLYVFARVGLRWDRRASSLCSALFALQLPALRLSWDLLRNELGLALLLLTLALLRSRAPGKRLLLAIASALTVMAHELPAIVLFVCLAWAWIRRDREALELGPALLPAAALLLARLAAHVGLLEPIPPLVMPREVIRLEPLPLKEAPLQPLNNVFLDYRFLGASYARLALVVAKLTAALYLPLAPLAIPGLFRHRELDVMAGWLALASFSVLACPWAYPFKVFHRWLFMLVLPASIYAANGLLKLRARLGRRGILAISLCLLAYGYVAVGYASGTYFCLRDPDVNSYVPPKLLEASIGVSQVPDCVACLRWLNEHAPGGAVLVAEERFYIWALNFLDERIALAYYPHGYPLELVPIEELEGRFSAIYLMWYAGQELPGFRQIYARGGIAIYVRT